MKWHWICLQLRFKAPQDVKLETGLGCNEVKVTSLQYFVTFLSIRYFLLVTSYNFMLYFYFYFCYFFKLLLYFVTSYFYQKVQKYFCVINISQVDNQYGLWLQSYRLTQNRNDLD